MLPPSPDNTLPDFFDMIVAGERAPALCHTQPRRSVDMQRYWEKRRVQNSLRRLLESLQECFDGEGGKETTMLEQTAMLGGVAHDELRRIWSEGSGNMRMGLSEKAFTQGLELLSAWPPELSAADRREVFTALLASSVAAVRALSLGQPLPMGVTKRMLQSGLQRIPFNLPDFPVPAYLVVGTDPVTGKTLSEVADAIAQTFSIDYTGLDHVKDFFLCGLLSLEEIQAALPFVAASSVVEEAVRQVIGVGRDYFTSREWQLLVEEPSGEDHPEMQQPPPPPQPGQPPLPGNMPQETPRPVNAGHSALDSPVSRYCQFSPMPSEPAACAVISEVNEKPSADEKPSAIVSVTRSEPIAHQNHHEETNSGHCAHHVINWGTTQWATGAEQDASGLPPGHQADVGAGTRGNGQEIGQQPETALHVPSVPAVVAPHSSMPYFHDDPLRCGINVDLHHECTGPFLATAFVRCCQLYDAHRDDRCRSQPRRAA